MEAGKTKLRLKAKKEHGIVGAVLFGLIFTVLFSVSFLLVAALCSYTTEDPSLLLKPLSYASLILSALIAGFSSGKYAGKKGALCGFLSGALFTLLLFSVSFLGGYYEESALPVLLVTYLAFSLVSALFGHLGARKKEKRRRHT